MGFFNFVKAIKKIDFMSDSPKLKIEGSNSYKTFIGGFINLVLIILSIIGIIYFGQELVIKKQPIVVHSEMDGHQVGPFNITNGAYYFLLAVEYSNYTYFVNNHIYEFAATYEVNEFVGENNTQVYSVYPIEFDICSKFYTADQLNIGVDVNKFFCLKPGSAIVEGYWGASKMGFVRVILNKCVNTTENNNHCYPEETIDKYLNGGYLSMFITSGFMSFSDPQVPVEFKYLDFFNSLNFDFTFDYVFETKSLKFIDDQGFLLQELTEKEFPYLEPPLAQYYGIRGSIVCTVIIQGYRYGDRYNRSYTKIQDVLTKIGGLLKAFSIIATFIANVSSEFEFYGDSIHNFKSQLRSYFEFSEKKLYPSKLNASFDNNLSKYKLTGTGNNYITASKNTLNHEVGEKSEGNNNINTHKILFDQQNENNINLLKGNEKLVNDPNKSLTNNNLISINVFQAKSSKILENNYLSKKNNQIQIAQQTISPNSINENNFIVNESKNLSNNKLVNNFNNHENKLVNLNSNIGNNPRSIDSNDINSINSNNLHVKTNQNQKSRVNNKNTSAVFASIANNIDQKNEGEMKATQAKKPIDIDEKDSSFNAVSDNKSAFNESQEFDINYHNYVKNDHEKVDNNQKCANNLNCLLNKDKSKQQVYISHTNNEVNQSANNQLSNNNFNETIMVNFEKNNFNNNNSKNRLGINDDKINNNLYFTLNSKHQHQLLDDQSLNYYQNFQQNSIYRNGCLPNDVKTNNNNNIANMRVINNSFNSYSKTDAIKDFFRQLFGYLYCKCNFNRRFLAEKEHYSNLISKLLSINYIFKKFFNVEMLTKKAFMQNEMDIYNDLYVFQLLNNTNSNQKLVCDDSDAFQLADLFFMNNNDNLNINNKQLRNQHQDMTYDVKTNNKSSRIVVI